MHVIAKFHRRALALASLVLPFEPTRQPRGPSFRGSLIRGPSYRGSGFRGPGFRGPVFRGTGPGFRLCRILFIMNRLRLTQKMKIKEKITSQILCLSI